MKGSSIRHTLGANEVKASFLLFIIAAVAVSLPFLIELPYPLAPVLVLCGFACVTTGLILLTFLRVDQVTMDVAGVVLSGEQIALGKIASDLGADGGAVIIPGQKPIQFIPVKTSGFIDSYLMEWNGSRGLSIPPPALPILNHLRNRNHLIIPEDASQALTAYAESVRHALELADRVEGKIDGETCIITITWYKLYDGCALVRKECPECCTMVPCGVCGLAGLILAEATGKPWRFSEVHLIPATRSIRLIITMAG